jgi:hypothetical protein
MFLRLFSFDHEEEQEGRREKGEGRREKGEDHVAKLFGRFPDELQQRQMPGYEMSSTDGRSPWS